jgi:hypothetical protein
MIKLWKKITFKCNSIQEERNFSLELERRNDDEIQNQEYPVSEKVLS